MKSLLIVWQENGEQNRLVTVFEEALLNFVHLTFEEKQDQHTEKKTWYCGQASCSLFTNFFGKKVTTNLSLSKLQTKFIDYRLNR